MTAEHPEPIRTCALDDVRARGFLRHARVGESPTEYAARMRCAPFEQLAAPDDELVRLAAARREHWRRRLAPRHPKRLRPALTRKTSTNLGVHIAVLTIAVSLFVDLLLALTVAVALLVIHFWRRGRLPSPLRRSLTGALRAQMALRCPQCAYDLAALTDSLLPDLGPQRCPECGIPWPLIPPAIPGEPNAGEPPPRA